MKSLMFILMLMLFVGCDSFPTDAVVTPGSVDATVRTDPKTGEVVKHVKIVTPGYKGPGAGATAFQVKTPGVDLGGDGVKTTEAESGFTLKGVASNPWTYLYLFSGLGILGGLVYTQFGGLGRGLGIAAASATTLVFIHFVNTMPTLAFGILAIAIGGGIFWYIQSKKGKDVKKTLADIIRSVEETGGDVAAAIKKKMEKIRHNKDVVKKIIDEAKNGGVS